MRDFLGANQTEDPLVALQRDRVSCLITIYHHFFVEDTNGRWIDPLYYFNSVNSISHDIWYGIKPHTGSKIANKLKIMAITDKYHVTKHFKMIMFFNCCVQMHVYSIEWYNLIQMRC